MSLVDQLRTCAAAITASQASGNPWDTEAMGKDAARLLTEAADLLDKPVLQPIVKSSHVTRHFDDGRKRGTACGNDPQAMNSIGRLR